MQDLSLFIQNHWVLSLFFIILLTLLLIIEFIRQKRGTIQVSASQLTDLLNHKNAVVVDLRPTDAYTKGHIINALSFPLAELKKNIKKLEKMKERPLVLACAKGLDSPKIATFLQQQGFHVHILGGGVEAWISASMPLVKD